MTPDEKKKAELAYSLGRHYFHNIVDSQGYPNGMPYWPEMSVDEKYYYIIDALVFLENVKNAGLISFVEDVSLGLRDSQDKSREYIMAVISEKSSDELEAFNNRLKKNK